MSRPGDVSIVIPCYNLGQFLGETISSIEAARSPSLREVVIVDDGSTEPRTIEVLDDLRKRGYSMIRQPNRGVSAARNAGIRATTGRYILPVDSDNRIRRPYLTDAVRLLDTDKSVGVVYGDAEYYGERHGHWRVDEFSLSRLILHNYIDSCALFRREVWEELGGYDERMPYFGWEDWDLWLRAALRGWRFAHLPEVAFDYRVRPGSLLQQANERAAVIDAYMFSKAEFASVARLRPELHRLWIIEQSMEYRLGRRLLSPIRRAAARFHRAFASQTADPVRKPVSSIVEK
jgi:glycosyltransferase involved in cell wall biosynthesis